MLEEILRKFNVTKERLGIHNDSSRDVATHLRGAVRLLVLHAEGVAQILKDLKH